jgi:hypothetical protein
MSGSSSLSVSDKSDGSRDRDLPSFTPLRDVPRESDKPESSASGSRRSARSSTHEESPNTRETARDSKSSEYGSLTRADGTVRRSRPHSSGGFLLDTALHPRRAFLSRSKKGKASGGRNGTTEASDIKGKRPREESAIVLPKRRARNGAHEKSASIGGSPLATEIKQDIDTEGVQNYHGLTAVTEPHKSTFLQAPSTGSPRYGSSLGPSRVSPSIGYDTDPAQIVNMALSLNEKRRRQASGTRIFSGQSAGTRAISGGLSPQIGQTVQFTTPIRASPRLTSETPNSDSRRFSGIVEQPQAFVGGPVAVEDETEMEMSLPISQATETRVQKAKTYFELAYEHRRLLSHLPPIRRPSASLQEGGSKIYNPLQYCRNRKLRFSEKHPIASEAEGWHDIDQVRDWVEAVIEAHTDTRHDSDECIRLPDLSHHKAPDPEEEENEDRDPMSLDSPASSLQRLSSLKLAKPTRPRSDWVTHPGDLIADASWLEQGQNKLKILDREGNKIYPPNTRFRFSGWRNKIPIHVPERLQEGTAPPEQEDTDRAERLPTPPPSALPELPTFTSTHKDKILKRTRRENTFKGKLGSATKDHKFAMLDGESSDSSSSAGDTDADGSVRGRKRVSRKRQESHDGRTGNIWKLKSAPDDRGSRENGSSGEHSFDQSANSSKRPSVDHARLSKFFTRDSRTDSSKNVSKTRSGSGRRESTNGPPSRGSYDGGNAPRSSAEYDTTAPTSPTGMGFPSIAINLSPPPSRSPSPTKKAITSILNPFRGRSQSKIREGIEVSDFGKPASQQDTQKSSNETDHGHESPEHASRGTSPMTRGKSPMIRTVSTISTHHEPESAADEHRGSTVSRLSAKSTHTDGHSKVRGVFKGGRITQLVGNEISKVGDYIWKRDAPASVRRDSTTSTIDSLHPSDSDNEPFQNGVAYKTPQQHEKRFPTTETETQRAKRLSPSDSQSSPEEERLDPRYHNPNLPSFTSPFQKDKDTQEEKKRNALSPTNSLQETKTQQDHISHLATEHRNATKSPRMGLLAPPKLNMSRSASPGAPFTMSDYDRRSSYGFGEDLDLLKSRDASQIFNNAIKTNGTMVTGLSSIDPTKSRSRSRVDLFRTRSQISASSAASEVKDVSKRDIAFTDALLMSSAVKAREIVLRADLVRDPVPAFVLNTIDPDNQTLYSHEPLSIRRKEEHVVAARNLITRLEKDGQRFQVKLQAFQSTISPNLHRALQGLEDLVDNGLTPRVRRSGDEAGELSMKLSTTSTLAVKDVNERIDAAMRRRRRGPVRWLRRFGYLCIEWVVVALLWGIWAIVSVLRVFRALVEFFVRLVRWLLFL